MTGLPHAEESMVIG